MQKTKRKMAKIGSEKEKKKKKGPCN